MYTIDNFLEIKREIYEYCLNLTITRNNGIVVRHKDRADDLFQDVYLKSYEYLPTNRNKIVDKGMYIQIIKNLTFWVHAAKYNQKLKGNKLLCNLNYYQDSPISEYYINEILHESPKTFEKIIDSPDFKFYTKELNKIEIQIIEDSINGYNMLEILKKYNIDNNMFYLVFEKVSLTAIKSKSVKCLNLNEFKERIINFKKYKVKKERETIYQLWLNNKKYTEIAEEMNFTVAKIRSIIFQINRDKLNKKINEGRHS